MFVILITKGPFLSVYIIYEWIFVEFSCAWASTPGGFEKNKFAPNKMAASVGLRGRCGRGGERGGGVGRRRRRRRRRERVSIRSSLQSSIVLSPRRNTLAPSMYVCPLPRVPPSPPSHTHREQVGYICIQKLPLSISFNENMRDDISSNSKYNREDNPKRTFSQEYPRTLDTCSLARINWTN